MKVGIGCLYAIIYIRNKNMIEYKDEKCPSCGGDLIEECGAFACVNCNFIRAKYSGEGDNCSECHGTMRLIEDWPDVKIMCDACGQMYVD